MITENGCVEGWPGRYDKDGYPRTLAGGKYRLVARLMYELYRGPVPDGMCIRHRCDNRKCINPQHLEVGTHQDNMADAKARGRHCRGEAHRWTRFPDAIVSLIRSDPQRYSVHVVRELWGIRKSQYYRIVNGESRQIAA